MNDCRYCGDAAQQSTLMLVDRRLLDGGLPRLNRFYTKQRCALGDLIEAEVGDCCEEYAFEDLAHLREELLALSRDPSLEARTIRALWGLVEGDPDFGVALLANPNVPTEFVRRHAPYYFEGVAENPSLVLWLLEDPGFLHSIAQEFILERSYGDSSGWRAPCSEAWLRHLSTSEDLRERRFAASHANLPGDCAWQLADDPDPYTRGYLSYHSRDYELLWYLAQDPALETREIAARAGSHPQVMAHLATDANKSVRSFVVRGDYNHDEIPRERRWELHEEPTVEELWQLPLLNEKRCLQQAFSTQQKQRRRRPRHLEAQSLREKRQEREFFQRRGPR